MQILKLLNLSSFRHWLSSLISMQLTFLWGAGQGFSSVFKSQIESESSQLNLNIDQISWIISLYSAAYIAGSILSTYIIDAWGRKFGIQISSILSSSGWCCIFFGYNVVTLYIGRFLGGTAAGMTSCMIVYITETCPDSQRSQIVAITTPCLLLGVAIIQIIGYNYKWHVIALAYAIYNFFTFLSLLLIPESPYWYILVNQPDKALSSLKWLRRSKPTEQISHELLQIQTTLKVKLESNDKDDKTLLQNVIETRAWKPFFILISFLIIQQLAGYSILLNYSIDFYNTFNFPISVELSATGYIVCAWIGSILYTYIISKMNNRTLMICSSTILTTMNLMVAGYNYWFSDATGPYFWFPIICTWIGVIGGIAGLYVLPVHLTPVLYPTRVRGFLVSLTYFIGFLATFSCIKIFPLIQPSLDGVTLPALFACFAALAIILSIWILPETRGKSLNEIEKLWLPSDN